MEPENLTDALKREAARLGFELAGACRAVAPPGIGRFRQWLGAGHAGRMHYLAERFAAYEHARHVLDGVRSILMLGMGYRTQEPGDAAPGHGRISRYAWGTDYHDLIHERLKGLIAVHRRLRPDAAVRGVVDTAPLLERGFAQLAGLGWIGKNTLLLNRKLGSWLFLAALLTSEPLVYDEPQESAHCGTCRACLDACPTGALADAYTLDARKCISYLTIEHRGPVPREHRRSIGPWLFGCDACQEVCPWNRRAQVTDEVAFSPKPGTNPAELADLLRLDDAEFRRRFRHTPLWRAKRAGLLRNAAVVLGCRPQDSDVAALNEGLADADPTVRSACAWALGECAGAVARTALESRQAVEPDTEVLGEIRAALGNHDPWE